jgi:hypothetical protein
MNKICTLVCMLVISVVGAGSAAAAEWIQLSLTPDIALHDRNTYIEGVSLNIWGENPQSSCALGFVNGFKNQSKGAALGLFNYSDGYTGFQLAAINYTNGSMLGWQMGLFDYTVGSMQGIQLGFINYAGQLRGVQLGLLNYAASAASGVQIGLINIIPINTWFTRFPDQIAPGMVLFNWRF